MERKPTAAEAITPVIKAALISPGVMSFNLKTPAPTMMGVESKKENLAAASRVRPRARPAVMVTPERDTPGMMAKAWERPMSRLPDSDRLWISLILAALRSTQ